MGWLVAGLMYVLIGIGCGVELWTRDAPAELSIVSVVMWPVHIGMAIGDRAIPIEQAHYRRAGIPFNAEKSN